jgi:hypothetical protein
VKGYLKQQYEYGRAEALLERKWPERYNRMGHLAWAGRVYGAPLAKVLGGRWKIYYGTWGTGLFQSVYQRAPGILGSLPLMPEWYLVIALLAGLSLLGILWTPLLLAVPLLAAATGGLLFKAALGGAHASVASADGSRGRERRMRLVTAFLYLAQPAARLAGRLRHGLSPWRRRSAPRLGLPLPRTTGIWSEEWRAPDDRVRTIADALRAAGGVVFAGGDFERWDLHVRGGMLGSVRMRMAVEEHGAGRQLLRIRSWPRCSRIGVGIALVFAGLATAAALSAAWIVAAVMAVVVAVILACIAKDCATAAGVLHSVLVAEAQRELEPPPAPPEASLNGHLVGDAGQVMANGNGRVSGDLTHPGVTFGTQVQMTKRRLGLRGEREQ